MELFVWVLLLLNACWDLLSFLSICIGGSRCQPIANMHLGLWIDQNDQNNPAAVFLMSLGTLVMGASRISACIDESQWLVACCSYLVEFIFAAFGVSLGLLHATSGVFVAISSVALAAIVFIFH